MTGDFRPCAVVPTFDNERTVRAVVAALRPHVQHVVLVDDGSGPGGRAACAALATEGLAHLERHARNRGKGAAVKTGMHAAAARGFTHVLQVDADGQHDLARVPDFLLAGARNPEALILGCPIYDATAPANRLVSRRITSFWVGVELGRRDLVLDAMVGFRVYPLAAALASATRGDRMDFDIEIAVRLARAGTPIVNLPVGVRYLEPAEGGVSHFRPLRDNLRFFWLHSRLCSEGVWSAMRGSRDPQGSKA